MPRVDVFLTSSKCMYATSGVGVAVTRGYICGKTKAVSVLATLLKVAYRSQSLLYVGNIREHIPGLSQRLAYSGSNVLAGCPCFCGPYEKACGTLSKLRHRMRRVVLAVYSVASLTKTDICEYVLWLKELQILCFSQGRIVVGRLKEDIRRLLLSSRGTRADACCMLSRQPISNGA